MAAIAFSVDDDDDDGDDDDGDVDEFGKAKFGLLLVFIDFDKEASKPVPDFCCWRLFKDVSIAIGLRGGVSS